MTDKINTIKNIFSTAGYENKLTDFILEEIKEYGDECFIDKIGNLIFHKKGQTIYSIISEKMLQQI